MKIYAYQNQINECGLKFLVEECHLDESWLREVFDVIPVTPKD